ncbi:bacteriophage abortive infection AbiH family protein [Bifidobacterium sp. ESL0690]|uniref:bacteriophage abortive infection AbiH family protein n=1 Tax=Bifidobacterium sp. ESL0690 TaxID=2983214 RepID=UPI0023F95A21|nr:bacteriophage abortive infection AbiH family protein [Bifidobacterium sp. ESL0690]WEV47660.1 bacteriophage abortive infection AbiH family protein [Bifidobacterium sp. ESL0690]
MVQRKIIFQYSVEFENFVRLIYLFSVFKFLNGSSRRKIKTMACRLIILGNGFDIAHGFQTGYQDFRTWWMNHEPESFESFKSAIEDAQEEVGKHVNSDIPGYNPEEGNPELEPLGCKKFWNDIESSLTIIPEYRMWLSEKIGGDADDFILSRHTQDIETTPETSIEAYPEDRSDYADHYDDHIPWKDAISGFYNAFDDWIEGIDKTIQSPMQARVNFNKHFSDTDNFLTFNYTHTLERVYGVPASRVLHIHGEAKTSMHESSVILGHDMPNFTRYDDPEGSKFADEIMADVTNDTFKDTQTLLKEHESWFVSTSQYDEIDIYGHSLSDVDMYYFSEIATHTTNAQWVVYAFRLSNNDFLKKNLESQLSSIQKNLRKSIKYRDCDEF